MNNQQFEGQQWQSSQQQYVNTDPREQQSYSPPPISADRGEKIQQSPRRRRRAWLWIVIGLVIIALLGSGINAGRTSFLNSSSETHAYSVSGLPTLVINDTTGSITIHTGNVSSVSIQAIKHTPAFGNAPTVQYGQSGDGNTVTATVQGSSGGLFGIDAVDFNVTLPANADLQLHTDTGTIDVSGVNGAMSLTTDTGSINANQDTLKGQSILKSNTGSITFVGSIDANGNYQFLTDTGSVDVTLPGSSSFHVDATTDTGSINSDFPEVNVQHHDVVGSDAHGDVGSTSSTMVTLKTNTGSINLHKGQ